MLPPVRQNTPSSALGKSGGEGLERAPAMTDGILFGGSRFSERLIQIVAQEQRIVAEAFRSAGRLENPAGAHPFEDLGIASGSRR